MVSRAFCGVREVDWFFWTGPIVNLCSGVPSLIVVEKLVSCSVSQEQDPCIYVLIEIDGVKPMLVSKGRVLFLDGYSVACIVLIGLELS